MQLRLQRRLAMALFHCGFRKVWMDPTRLETIAKAKSRNDIRDLVTQGLIKHKIDGPQVVPQQVVLHRLLTARRLNHKKQIRENRAAHIAKQQQALRDALAANPPQPAELL